MLAHHVAFADLDARDCRAEAQSLFRIEGESLQFLDFLDVNEMLGAADSGAELDEDVGAAAEWAGVFAVSFEDTDRLIERARGFVIDSVQEWRTSGRGQDYTRLYSLDSVLAAR